MSVLALETTWLRRSVPWRGASVRTAVYVLLTIQIGQTALTGPTDFAKSYWMVNYDYGFVRRGLAGEFTASLEVLGPRAAVAVSAAAVGLASVLAVVCVLEALLRKGTSASAALAMLIAASPFVVDQMLFHRRPDQLGLVILIATGFVLRNYRGRRQWPFAILGVGFAVAVFVHEGVALFYLPGALALVMVVAARRGLPVDATRVLLLGVPGVVAATVVAALGRATPEHARLIAESDPLRLEPNIFPNLSDGLVESIAGVAHIPLHTKIIMLGVGMTLLAVQWLWVTRLADVHVWNDFRSASPRWLTTAIVGCLACGLIVVFATGTDWTRWFCIFGSVYLCIAAFSELVGVAEQGGKCCPTMLPRWVFPAALYLAVLLPLPEMLSVDRVIHSFLLVG